ncbi:hypothetical protein RB595_002030 [Gaeumannomyces hyphopodioides]
MPARIKSERRAQTVASGSAPRPSLSPGTAREFPTGRAARSAAPSASTFQALASLPAASEAEEVDEDIMIMETRPKQRGSVVKSEFISSEPQNESFFGGSISNDSVLRRNFGKIANNLTALGETLGELHTLGIQHVAALPSLVLVGDQSSGKSTLMSGIAGISLPQSDGMCTRCPLHIRLAKSPTWKLQISLQQDYKFEPRVRHKEFGNWIDQPRVTKEFWSTTVKDDGHIRMALGWAQVAILNHDTNYRQYIPMYRGPLDMEHEKARLEEQERSAVATFSPNTVALHISGPSCPDLSFYDLPGIIKTPKHEEQSYLVKMVENLATKYITDKNAIIMWAVAMNADPENSSTLTLIRGKKAKDRTVGVMTKADLLPQSGRNHDQWLHMLQGKQHSVGHGFFITARQPTQSQGHDLEHQNSFEESYFNYRSDEANNWPRTFGPFTKRCGLQALVVFLSETLSNAFHQSLPGILDMIENRLGDVNEELKRLPDTPQHPYNDMIQAMFMFRKEVENELKMDGEFDKAWGVLIDTFEEEILKLKPKYNIKDPKAPRPTPPVTPTANRTIQVIDLVKSSDEAPDTPSRRRNHRAFMEGQDTASGTPKRPRYMTVKDETESRAGSVAPSQSGNADHRTLEQVRKCIRGATKHGVPDEMPTEVMRSLSLEAIARWDVPLHGLMAQFVRLLQDHLQKLLERSFDNLHYKAVFRDAQEVVDRFVDAQEAALKQMLSALHHRESGRLYTRDKITFNYWKQYEHDVLVHSRHHYRWAAHLASQRNPKEPGPLVSWDELSAQQRHEEEKERQTLQQTYGPDPYEKELTVCSYVRAYYQTAARRFIDTVAMAVGAELIPALVSRLAGEYHLDQSLGFRTGATMDDARLEELMAEQPEVAAKRRKLQDEQGKLESAMASINKLKLESADNDSAVDVGSQTNPATSFASRGERFQTVVLDDDESAVA